jgi:hypothetical protein
MDRNETPLSDFTRASILTQMLADITEVPERDDYLSGEDCVALTIPSPFVEDSIY